MKARPGQFLVLDGLTGSGKGTVSQALAQEAARQGKRVFSLSEWSKTHRDPPTIEEIGEADVLFTFEPTKTWVGAAIRYELSRTDRRYSGRKLAHAFSLDREIMYRRLIVPALAAGKQIIQERSVSSSILLQPIMPDNVLLGELLEMEGNQLAFEHAPSDLLLLHTTPETAVERIQSRADEDKGVFQDPSFIQRSYERLHAEWFRDLFERQGTRSRWLDAEQLEAETVREAITIFHSFDL